MQFKLLIASAGMLAVSSVHAAFNLTDVIGDIGDVASLAGEVVTLFDNLDITTILSSAPKIIDNISQIVTIITTDIGEIDGDSGDDNSTSYSTADETDACGGLETFLESVGQIADSVAGKIDIVSGTPFSGAIGDIITSIKDGVDDFGSKILDLVPSCGDSTSSYSLESVSASFDTCLKELS
ncbi:hypothetical protein G7Z17_g8764 [Cylindrodendrum hubeiense]|uniref:Uncharacterized protein n=1 Tax=Cylindrodendrum hubeiense TaxID=595255 RepID=A0A9P5L8Q8_9HYPO|nr:hypothetical protein G7Z17_g8764 [Cylindrodendrum hubeiense]